MIHNGDDISLSKQRILWLFLLFYCRTMDTFITRFRGIVIIGRIISFTLNLQANPFIPRTFTLLKEIQFTFTHITAVAWACSNLFCEFRSADSESSEMVLFFSLLLLLCIHVQSHGCFYFMRTIQSKFSRINKLCF